MTPKTSSEVKLLLLHAGFWHLQFGSKCCKKSVNGYFEPFLAKRFLDTAICESVWKKGTKSVRYSGSDASSAKRLMFLGEKSGEILSVMLSSSRRMESMIIEPVDCCLREIRLREDSWEAQASGSSTLDAQLGRWIGVLDLRFGFSWVWSVRDRFFAGGLSRLASAYD